MLNGEGHLEWDFPETCRVNDSLQENERDSSLERWFRWSTASIDRFPYHTAKRARCVAQQEMLGTDFPVLTGPIASANVVEK